jgi:hypothetical protein
MMSVVVGETKVVWLTHQRRHFPGAGGLGLEPSLAVAILPPSRAAMLCSHVGHGSRDGEDLLQHRRHTRLPHRPRQPEITSELTWAPWSCLEQMPPFMKTRPGQPRCWHGCTYSSCSLQSPVASAGRMHSACWHSGCPECSTQRPFTCARFWHAATSPHKLPQPVDRQSSDLRAPKGSEMMMMIPPVDVVDRAEALAGECRLGALLRRTHLEVLALPHGHALHPLHVCTTQSRSR